MFNFFFFFVLGNSIGSAGSQGGVGNPFGGCTSSAVQSGTGTGGLIILIVGGNLTIGVSGTIDASGVSSGGSSLYAAGGASGGGNIVIAYKGTFSNLGAVKVVGGSGFAAALGGQSGIFSGNGGQGSVQTLQII